MLRQSVSKLPVNLIRSTFTRSFAKQPCSLCPEEEEQQRQMKNSQDCTEDHQKQQKKDEQMCKEHAEMIPDFASLKNLKKFELKSNCNSFHWSSEGHSR